MGLVATHIGMDGVQRAPIPGTQVYDIVHQGIFVVPCTTATNSLFLGELAAALDAGADLYLSEVATPRHPVFFDFDGKFNLRSATHVRLMVHVIRAATLDWGDVDRVLTALQLRPASDMHSIDFSLARALEAGHAAGWTWLDVVDLCLTLTDKTVVDSVNPNLLHRDVAPVLCTLFIMAVGTLVQQVVKTFWPHFDQDPTSIKTVMMVLGNMGPEAYQEIVGTSPTLPTYFKVGAHLHSRGLIGNLDTDLYLRQSVLHHFQTLFGPSVLGQSAEAFWGECFDASVYTRGATAGIRMAYNLKADVCGVCKNKHPYVRTCVACNRIGRFSVQRYYGPVVQLNSTGRMETSAAEQEKIYHNKRYVLTMCSLRVPPQFALTSGIVLADKPAPQNLRDVRMQTLLARVGGNPNKARTVVNRISKSTGIKEDDLRFTHFLEAEFYFQDIMHNRKDAPPFNRQQHVAPGDPRFIAVAGFLPLFCKRVFSERFGSMEVTTLTLIRNAADGEPQTLFVGVRSTDSMAVPCFNRIDGGVWPTPHTNWTQCVYFEITRQDTGMVRQKCCNSNERDDTRRIHLPAGAKVGSCKYWSGECRPIAPPPMPAGTNETLKNEQAAQYARFVRNMFYLPEEQTYETCLKVVSDQAARLQRQYKKRKTSNLFPEVVGNHPAYAAEISKVLHSGSKKPFERLLDVVRTDGTPAAEPTLGFRF